MDFEPFFRQYEKLLNDVDAAFSKIKASHSECVHCTEGCSDCCHALFDLTLVEALYINDRFRRGLAPERIREILGRADIADRAIAKLKRQAHKAYEQGKSENEILLQMASLRVRCPALNEENRCTIYDFRPITCRLYGVPTVIGEGTHTCGISGFEPGKSYPSVKLDIIHQRLYEISFSLAREIQSRYAQLAEMLVPLSMALLTDYTPDYLGIGALKDAEKENEA